MANQKVFAFLNASGNLPSFRWLWRLKWLTVVPFSSQSVGNVQLCSRPRGSASDSVVVELRQVGLWWCVKCWVGDDDTCTPEGKCHNSSLGRLGTGSQTYTPAAAEGG